MRRTTLGAALAPLLIGLAIKLALLFILIATLKAARRTAFKPKPAGAAPSASTPSPPFPQDTAAATRPPARR